MYIERVITLHHYFIILSVLIFEIKLFSYLDIMFKQSTYIKRFPFGHIDFNQSIYKKRTAATVAVAVAVLFAVTTTINLYEVPNVGMYEYITIRYDGCFLQCLTHRCPLESPLSLPLPVKHLRTTLCSLSADWPRHLHALLTAQHFVARLPIPQLKSSMLLALELHGQQQQQQQQATWCCVCVLCVPALS